MQASLIVNSSNLILHQIFLLYSIVQKLFYAEIVTMKV